MQPRWFRRSAPVLVTLLVSLAASAANASPGGSTVGSGQASKSAGDSGQSSSLTADAASSTATILDADIAQIQAARRIDSLSQAQASSPAIGQSNAGPDASPRSRDPRINRSLARERTTSGSPGANAAAPAPLAVPNVQPTAVSTRSGASLSFSGLNLYQERYVASAGNQFTLTPPDQGLCVGGGFVLETVNDVMRVFNTSGHPLTDPIGMNAFYGYPPEINRTTGEFGPEPTDPSCYYDPQNQRWFHVVLTLEVNPVTGNLTLANHLDVAVSATSSPLNGWVFYHIQVTDDGKLGTPKHKDCPCVGDYPHIGADANGFHITTNEYPWIGTTTGIFGNDYNGAQLYSMSKFALAQGSPTLTVLHKGGMTLAGGTPSFTMWPSEAPGTAFDTRDNGSEWFVQSAATPETLNTTGMSNQIGLWRLSNTKSLNSATPKLALESKTLTSEAYGIPPPSEQRVGPVPLRDCLIVGCLPGIGPSNSEVESAIDSNDSRTQQVWLAGGRLFTALDTVALVNGRLQAGVAYFVLKTADKLSGVSFQKQGYVAVAGNLNYPAIATLSNGSGAMAVTLVGPSNYPSAAYMTVGPNGPTGSVIVAAGGVGPDDEFCGYLFYNCKQTPTPAIRPRWGDYGAAAVDGSKLWIASEWIAQSCTLSEYIRDPQCDQTRATLGNWATRISEIAP